MREAQRLGSLTIPDRALKPRYQEADLSTSHGFFHDQY
jgi:hypothetical protein